MSDQAYVYGTGRRKTAIAQVRLYPGNGSVIIDGKTLEERFPSLVLRARVLSPLQITGTLNKYNIIAKLCGGGVTGQAEAVRHGIARALAKEEDGFKSILRHEGLLTRDPRVKERKKYGLKRARKAPQYTKR